jgi:hypothetical protein
VRTALTIGWGAFGISLFRLLIRANSEKPRATNIIAGTNNQNHQRALPGLNRETITAITANAIPVMMLRMA